MRLCATTITVGTITNLSTAVKIYVKDRVTGVVTPFSTTSSSGGVVTWTITETYKDTLALRRGYQIWVTLASGATNARLPIVISGLVASVTCIELQFLECVGGNDTDVILSR